MFSTSSLRMAWLTAEADGWRAVHISFGLTLAGAMAMETQRKHAGMASAFLGTLMFVMGGISAPLTGIGGTSMASMTVVILLSYVLALVSYLVLGRQKTV